MSLPSRDTGFVHFGIRDRLIRIVISFETGAPLAIRFRKIDGSAPLIEAQHDYEPPTNGLDQLHTRIVPEVARGRI